MLWGCVSSVGTRKLVGLEGTIDGSKHRAIVEEILALEIEFKNFIFQQDNDRKHSGSGWVKANILNVFKKNRRIVNLTSA